MAQTLVLGVAKTCVGLFLGHAQGMVGVVQAERLNNIVAGLDVAGTVLDDGAGLTDAAHEDVEDGVTLRGLRGVNGLVGGNAQGHAGVGAALDVDLDGFLDLVGLKPAHLGGLLEGPLAHVLLHDLERGAGGLAVGQLVGAEHLGVDGAVSGERVGHGDGGVRLLVPHDVLVLGAQAQLGGTVGEAGVLMHEEGQVRPLAAEVVIPQLVLDDVVDPGEHERHVGAGTDGEPHVGAGSVGGKTGVDDDRLHAGVAQVGDHAAGGTGAVVGRTNAPHDIGLRGRALVLRQQTGQVDLGDRAVSERGVSRAVEAELHVVTRQVALGAARLEEVAAAPHGQEACRREELGVAAATRGADKGLGALLLVVLPHDVADLVDGLLPGDALPLVGAALANALHGVLDAVGVVERLDTGETLGAHAALVHGVVGVALELDDLAVLDVGDHAAVVKTCAAHRTQLLDLAFLCLRRSGGKQVRGDVRRHCGGCSPEGGQVDEVTPGDSRLCQNFLPLSRLNVHIQTRRYTGWNQIEKWRCGVNRTGKCRVCGTMPAVV